MIFRPELARQVDLGEKTATRRVPSDKPRSPWYKGGCSYTRGQTFAVQPGRGKPSICQAIVDRVALERLGDVTEADARREGFRGPAEFYEAWREINGAVLPQSWVWVVEFHVPGIPF